MENNQGENLLYYQGQPFAPSNTGEPSQNMYSAVNQTYETARPTSRLLPTAAALNPGAAQGFAAESNPQLSGADSAFNPTASQWYLSNNPAPTDRTPFQTPHDYNYGREVMVGASMSGTSSRRNHPPRPVQLPEYHGVELKGKGKYPRKPAQQGYQPISGHHNTDWNGEGSSKTFQYGYERTQQYGYIQVSGHYEGNSNGEGPSQTPQYGYGQTQPYYGGNLNGEGPRQTSQHVYGQTSGYQGVQSNDEGPNQTPQYGYEHTSGYQGIQLNEESLRDTSENGLRPLLPQSIVPEAPSSTFPSANTNDTRPEDVPQPPPSADGDWFLPITFDYEIKALSSTPKSADEILYDLGFPKTIPSDVREVCHKQWYHQEPDVHSLTHVLKIAKTYRDSNAKAFKSQEESLRNQVAYLRRVTQELRSQAAWTDAELADTNTQLSVAQEEIEELRGPNLAHVLTKQQKLMAENEQLRRRRDWYLKRCYQLQFVEMTNLKTTIRKQDAAIKDMRSTQEDVIKCLQQRNKNLEWSLGSVRDECDNLQRFLFNAMHQRDIALEELAGFKQRSNVRFSVHSYGWFERSSQTRIRSLTEQVSNLERHGREAESARAENKELKRNNDRLQTDCDKLFDQVSKFKRDPANVRRAMGNLDKVQKAVEENEKQRTEAATKSKAEKEELKNKILGLQEQLKKQSWDAEKAKLEASKDEEQEVEDAITEENARGTEIVQCAQDLAPPSTNPFPKTSAETGPYHTSDLPEPHSRIERLEPTGRDEYM
jgi:hypothetical protein